MAGEWLKLELSTPDKPELLKLSRITQLHKDAVLGKLIRIWAWFDRNSVDGHVDGVVAADIDELALHDGFSIALKQVNWMDFSDSEQWVKLMNFDRHNGETAKTRALKTKRQEKWRANKDANVDYETSTQTSTTASTREEKRREDINNRQQKLKIHLLEDGTFENLNGHLELWKSTYQHLNVEHEIKKAASWCLSNPTKAPKSNYARFLNGWLSRQKPTNTLDDIFAGAI